MSTVNKLQRNMDKIKIKYGPSFRMPYFIVSKEDFDKLVIAGEYDKRLNVTELEIPTIQWKDTKPDPKRYHTKIEFVHGRDLVRVIHIKL